MSADDAPSSTPRAAPIALWRVAEAFLHTLHGLFGAPEDVAADHTLLRKAHAQLAQWLRCAEAMLRRLLLIEAQAYAKPNTRPLLHTSRQRERKLCYFQADKPEAWRVSFRVLHLPPQRGGSPERSEGKGDVAPSVAFGSSSPARGGDKKRFYSAWPLAERYEALLRVFNDPAPYASRLARRLHATPHRIVEALRAPPEAVHRIDCFDAMTHQAESAWRPHFSSA
jgi:hypothetical protein